MRDLANSKQNVIITKTDFAVDQTQNSALRSIAKK